MFLIKKILATICDVLGVNLYKFKKLNRSYSNNYIRIINYHMTPLSSKNNFENQVKWISKHFENCDEDKLESFLNGNYQFKDKPGVMFTFDDGFSDNYEVAYPILKKYGFIGYFMISAGLIDKKDKYNHNYMTQKQLIELISNNQVIGCHTYTHHRMNINDTKEILRYEVIDAKNKLEEILNSKINIFCWCGGEENTYTKQASDFIKQAGYKYSMTTLSSPTVSSTNRLLLDRINVESWWSLGLLRFSISGYMDKRLLMKRKRVHALIK